jgi:putative membrane protein
MKNLICLLSGVVALLFIQACQDKHGKNYNKPTIDENGVMFVKNGMEGNLAEIKASGLAITNSNNQRVIAFAKMMIEDHTKTIDVLKKMATDKQVAEIDTLSSAHRQMIDELSAKNDGLFDKAYLQMMVADHEQAVQLFTSAATNGDSDIKKTASKTLPVIQMHLDSARAILAGLK